jgi:four helix bundle protein
MEENFREVFKLRTKNFGLRVLHLFQSLPKTDEAQIIGKQILRSAFSVAANYRASLRYKINPTNLPINKS